MSSINTDGASFFFKKKAKNNNNINDHDDIVQGRMTFFIPFPSQVGIEKLFESLNVVISLVFLKMYFLSRMFSSRYLITVKFGESTSS